MSEIVKLQVPRRGSLALSLSLWYFDRTAECAPEFDNAALTLDLERLQAVIKDNQIQNPLLCIYLMTRSHVCGDFLTSRVLLLLG